jgi:hypothetical protein
LVNIANPDLVERFNADAPLNNPNSEANYIGEAGYRLSDNGGNLTSI